MKVVYVYADVVVLISILASVPMLWGAARAYGLKFRFGRALAASFVSGAATLFAIILRLPYVLMIVCAVPVFLCMIRIAFGRMKFRLVCHASGMVFAETALLCGFCMLVNNIFSRETRSFISIGCMAAGIVMLVAAIRMRKSAYAVSTQASSVQNYTIMLSVDTATASMDAVLDTGNLLTEPLSQSPVIILNYKLARQKFNDEIVKPIESNKGGNIRLVPFKGADSGGIMICVKADGVKIMEQGEWRDAGDAYIGISETIECDALIGTEILNRAV